MRRFRAIAIPLLAFVLLGAATTVAVAWGIALRGYDAEPFVESQPSAYVRIAVPCSRARLSPDSPALILISDDGGMGYDRLSIDVWPSGLATTPEHEHMKRLSIDWSGRSWLALAAGRLGVSRAPPREMGWRDEMWFGWPVRCLWSGESGRFSNGFGGISLEGWTNVLFVRRGVGSTIDPFIKLDLKPLSNSLAVPLGILPRGFAMNTAFYASAWWVLIFGLARARAWNRQRRGLCTKCTYDLRGLEAHTPCPECGKPTPGSP